MAGRSRGNPRAIACAEALTSPMPVEPCRHGVETGSIPLNRGRDVPAGCPARSGRTAGAGVPRHGPLRAAGAARGDRIPGLPCSCRPLTTCVARPAHALREQTKAKACDRNGPVHPAGPAFSAGTASRRGGPLRPMLRSAASMLREISRLESHKNVIKITFLDRKGPVLPVAPAKGVSTTGKLIEPEPGASRSPGTEPRATSFPAVEKRLRLAGNDEHEARCSGLA